MRITASRLTKEDFGVQCRVAQIPARKRDARGKLLSFAEHRSRWIDERARWREFVTRCPLVGPDPRRVLWTRAFLTTATSALVLFVMVENLVEAKGTPYYFVWLTNWTGVLTGVYAATHLLATARAFKEAERAGPRTSGLHRVETSDALMTRDDVPRVAKALWFCKASAPTCQCLITLMYWAILYNPAFAEPSASNVTAHGGLCAALLFDLFGAAALPARLAFDFLNALVFLVAYLAFNLALTLGGATNDAGEPYVYEILAWRTHPARAVVVVAFVAFFAFPLSFGVVWASARLRDGFFFPTPRAEGSAAAADRRSRSPPRVDAPSERERGEGGEARLRV